MKLALAIACVLGGCAEDATAPGPHHHYVVDSLELPTTNTRARELALDLDANGTFDNQLGLTIAMLAFTDRFDMQPSVDRAVATGAMLMLVDIQDDSDAARFELRTGTPIAPLPCVDSICGRHLEGDGTFAVEAARRSPLTGSTDEGVVVAGPGTAGMQLALGGTEVVSFELAQARVQVESFDDSHATFVLGGAISMTELKTVLIPTFHTAIVERIAADCSQCGCAPDSAGLHLMARFDTAPFDCAITLNEVLENSSTVSLTAADLLVDGEERLSFGARMTAVPATFISE